jgi:hypothetical protein
MPVRKSNRPISLIITREYNNVNGDIKSSENQSRLADFHLAGKNRYLKINQPEKTLHNKEMSKLSNPRVNLFHGDDEDDFERKKYVIEYKEDEKTDKKHNQNKINSTNETLSSAIDSDSDNKIDEYKVEKTVKMIEELLRENKPKKKVPTQLKLKNDLTSVSLKSNTKQPLLTNKTKNLNNNQRKFSINEHKKQNFFKEKNIRVNMSTADTDENYNMIKKPAKINVTNEVNQVIESSSNEDPKIDVSI